jgi:GNAT superfamily N-acetyltransferase
VPLFLCDDAPVSNDPDDDPRVGGPAKDREPHEDVEVRLIRPGEGTAAVAIAAAAHAPGVTTEHPLQVALDQFGGHIGFPSPPGTGGWCFGAFTQDRLVGMLYACSPVTFIEANDVDHRPYLARVLVEIEILAVDAGHRGQGAGTALLRFAEQYLHSRGVRLVVAKADAADRRVMLWYRHRGYTLARNGESCYIATADEPIGINAGPAYGLWRLAVKALGASITRRAGGLWPTDAASLSSP